ncbi:MAG: methylated-DNA--[protein]-cysteine S-methyltransferase [Cellvibrionaceae bacterium]
MTNQINILFYKTPYGELIIGSLDDQLCLCDWRYRNKRQAVDRRLQRLLKAEFVESGSQLIDEMVEQLEQFFIAKRTVFDIPLLFAGTPFQKAVWQHLLKIPYGQTTTYAELSESLGNRNAIRAVASANGANALSIIVPCHRVIGSSGELTGYAGGLKAKEGLLRLENPEYQNNVAKQQLNLL